MVVVIWLSDVAAVSVSWEMTIVYPAIEKVEVTVTVQGIQWFVTIVHLCTVLIGVVALDDSPRLAANVGSCWDFNIFKVICFDNNARSHLSTNAVIFNF